MDNKNERYIIENFFAKSLENNPLNSPINRDLRIYLPPDYFDSINKHYPVIYYLHGYGGNNHNWTITSIHENESVLPLDRIPKKFLDRVDLDKIVNYEKLDELISNGEIKPFIFVQPDASLHIPNKFHTNNLRGEPATKGSYYVNSTFSGNYMDYIVNDVIEHVDSFFRTIPDKNHRVLMGGSMGGAGTLRICTAHPEKFISAAALSPGNLNPDLLDWKLVVPLIKDLFGEKIAKKRGVNSWEDILDTCDLIFSKNNPLLPSIKRDDDGKIISLNEEALNNWMKYNINNLIKECPEALKGINLLINCALNDEMGSSIATKQIHETLDELKIPHQYELYDDPKTSLSPHILGIAYHIIPAIKFCVEFFN
ncbi:MAG: alpha/beta hydrolase [Candidatus Thorarchaeota archaeon]